MESGEKFVAHDEPVASMYNSAYAQIFQLIRHVQTSSESGAVELSVIMILCERMGHILLSPFIKRVLFVSK